MTVRSRRVKQVYRLEDSQGRGPFAIFENGMQYCAGLSQHRDPEDLVKEMGYSETLLKLLYKSGFVFGWRTRKSYKAFFNKGGEQAAARHDLTCHVYMPNCVFLLPDDQVMFLRPKDEVNVNSSHLLASMLKLL